VWWPGYQRRADGSIVIRRPASGRLLALGFVVVIGGASVLAIIGLIVEGELQEAGQALFVCGPFSLLTVVACLPGLRTRLKATADELVLCNGYRTVRIPWVEVEICVGLRYVLGDPILALGPGGDLVPVGQVRAAFAGSPLRSGLSMFNVHEDVFELDGGRRTIRKAGSWGGERLPRRAAAILVLRTDGRTFLSHAVPASWRTDPTNRRIHVVLRDLATIRAQVGMS
jgi:hypothetical protein